MIKKHIERIPLYTRMCFAAIVLFAFVGNCAGHRDGSVAIIVIMTCLWVSMRIIAEAFEAFTVLRMLKHAEQEMKEPPRDTPT